MFKPGQKVIITKDLWNDNLNFHGILVHKVKDFWLVKCNGVEMMARDEWMTHEG